MIKFRSAVLIAALALFGGAISTSAASAHERDCRCSRGEHHHHHHHAMGRGEHHQMHAMRHEGFEHHRFARDEHERGRFFMRFDERMGGRHGRFDVWYGPHPHGFAMMRGEEGCRERMRWHHRTWGRRAWGEPGEMPPPPPPGMWGRQAWGVPGDMPLPPPMAMDEWRERRHHLRHADDEDRDDRRGFDPYRDDWNSHGDDRDDD